tara:strand:- start:250 stop:783 length:534 start_codon:yes stop_codon:yes gene_type:complete
MSNYHIRNFNRYPIKEKKIYFRKGKNIISKNKTIFLRKYNAHSFIKILPHDFKLIKKNIKRLTHFNIQFSDHKPGKNYLIMKIYKQGYFNGSTSSYRHPILYCDSLILAKCLSAQNNIDYSNLKENDFKYSFSNIKSVNALKKNIKARYKKSLAHLSDIKKLSLGVAITKLEIIKRF